MADTPFLTWEFPAGLANMVPRSDRERIQDILNVKEFGAKGDNEADDHDAIQNCIDAAYGAASDPHGNANVTLNKAVYFPAGHYKIGSPLMLTAVQSGHLFGDGRMATWIANPYGTHVFDSDGLENTVFERMRVDATGAGACFNVDVPTKSAIMSIKNNSWYDVMTVAGTHGLRIGASDIGGENMVLSNCYLQQHTVAAVELISTQAIGGTMIGGNLASSVIGILNSGGCWGAVIGTCFINHDVQAVDPTNRADVKNLCDSKNVMYIANVRTESSNVVYNDSGINMVLTGINHAKNINRGYLYRGSGGCIYISGCMHMGKVKPLGGTRLCMQACNPYKQSVSHDWIEMVPSQWNTGVANGGTDPQLVLELENILEGMGDDAITDAEIKKERRFTNNGTDVITNTYSTA